VFELITPPSSGLAVPADIVNHLNALLCAVSIRQFLVLRKLLLLLLLNVGKFVHCVPMRMLTDRR